MDILTNKNLSDYVTMRLGGAAHTLIAVHNEQEVAKAVEYATKEKMPIITIGAGSNIIFKDSGFSGVVIVNKIKGLNIDAKSGLVRANSGEIWDDVVQKSLEAGYAGIESLTNIPGTAGAAPINNIGAYGQELKETLNSVRAYDIEAKTFIEINNEACEFTYRNSRFKSKDYDKFIICGITLKLVKTPTDYAPPEYQALNEELQNRNISNPTPFDVRQAVFTIRNSKLPNPAELPNTGSFFKNPIMTKNKAEELLKKYPEMPLYPQEGNASVKLSAGWLIENAGLKGYRQGGIWVYDKQALVLVNESAKSFKSLWFMAEHIIKEVDQKFGVILEPEPEII
jgi:UDP-N-acetylmuramate dehydrogenase